MFHQLNEREYTFEKENKAEINEKSKERKEFRI